MRLKFECLSRCVVILKEDTIMFPTSSQRVSRLLLPLAVVIVALAYGSALAQGGKKDKPLFNTYKGVSIGMNAEEARQKLGEPKDKGDTQDFYVFSDNETCQVFYDGTKKVSAISVSYTGTVNGALTAKDIFGAEVEAKPDGSAYKMVRYPDAGYWVAYFRSAGDTHLVTVTMQKIQ